MVKSIATIAILALMTLAGLGNYWFTFGLWPRSWWSFGGFFTLNTLLIALLHIVTKSDD